MSATELLRQGAAAMQGRRRASIAPFDFLTLSPDVLLMPADISGAPVDSWTNTGVAGVNYDYTGAGATRPAAGTVDGQVAAIFDGVDDVLDDVAGTLAGVIDPNAYTLLFVLNPTASGVVGGTDYAMSIAYGDTGGYLNVGVYASGAGYKVRALHWDSAARIVDSAELPFNTPIYVEITYDGATMSMRVAAAAAGTVAAAAVGSLTSATRIGRAYPFAGAAFFEGGVAFIFTKKAALSAGDLALARAGIVTYFPGLVV